jgi:hypothetical protein
VSSLAGVFLTNSSGQVTFTQQGPFPDTANATKTGYTVNSDSYECTPGANVDVTIFLEQVFELIVYAIDANSLDPIPFAQLFLDQAQITAESPTLGRAYKVATVNQLPFTVQQFRAVAQGYLAQQTISSATFTLTDRQKYLTLIPIPFTLNFLISELYEDNSIVINPYGLLDAKYVPGPNELVVTVGATVGGQTTRTTGSGIAYQNISSFAVNKYDNYTTIFVSQYTGIPPTGNNAPFALRPTNLTIYAENFNNTIKQSGSYPVNVPAYTETNLRDLFIPLPYRLNAAFLIIRATPYNTDGTTVASSFPIGNGQVTFNPRIFTTGQSSIAYQTTDVQGKARGTIEFVFNFGTFISDVAVEVSPEFFNKPISGFPDPSNPSVTLGPNQWQKLFGYTFPSPTLTNNLFVVDAATGQYKRRLNSQIYQLYDFKMIYNDGSGPNGKKRSV